MSLFGIRLFRFRGLFYNARDLFVLSGNVFSEIGVPFKDPYLGFGQVLLLDSTIASMTFQKIVQKIIVIQVYILLS